MSKLASIVVLMAVTVAGSANAGECRRGSAEILAISDWSARVVDAGFSEGIALSMTLENVSSYGIRMIDGRVFFEDVLGRSIVNVAIDDDARVSADGSFTQSGRYQAFGTTDVTRLATAESADIVATVCVESFVTTDGDVLRFD